MESMTQECGFKINAQINWIGALVHSNKILSRVLFRQGARSGIFGFKRDFRAILGISFSHIITSFVSLIFIVFVTNK